MMYRTAAILTLALLAATPAPAETGRDQMSEGMRLLLEGLMTEVLPLLEQLESSIDELSSFHAPEVLPNGDIIIRRKIPLMVDPPDEGEIDL